jgi:hypothetical protein
MDLSVELKGILQTGEEEDANDCWKSEEEEDDGRGPCQPSWNTGRQQLLLTNTTLKNQKAAAPF